MATFELPKSMFKREADRADASASTAIQSAPKKSRPTRAWNMEKMQEAIESVADLCLEAKAEQRVTTSLLVDTFLAPSVSAPVAAGLGEKERTMPRRQQLAEERTSGRPT